MSGRSAREAGGGGSTAPQGIGQPCRWFDPPVFAQKVVDINQPRAGDDPLPAHMGVSLPEITQQGDLQLSAGAEPGVPALRGERLVTGAVPVEAGLAQAGAGGDDAAVAAGGRIAGIEEA